MFITLRKTFALSVLLMASYGLSNAQYVDASFNPLSALTGTAVLMVEVPVTEMIGVELQSSYFFNAQRFWTPNYTTQGYRMGVLGHIYLNENAGHTKTSLFAYVRYMNVRYEDNGSDTLFDRDDYRLSQASIGLGASYKWLLDDHFVLSGGGGLGRYIAKEITREEGTTGDFLSLGFQARVNIDLYARICVGYRFSY